MSVAAKDKNTKKSSSGASKPHLKKDFSNVRFSTEKCSLIVEGTCSKTAEEEAIEDLLLLDELSSDDSSSSDDSIELFIAASLNKFIADNAANTSEPIADNAANTSKCITDNTTRTINSVNKTYYLLTGSTGKASLQKTSNAGKSFNETCDFYESLTPSMFGPKKTTFKPDKSCLQCEKKLRTIRKLRERVKELEQQCDFLQEPHTKDLHRELRKQSLLTDKLKSDLQNQQDKMLTKYQLQLDQKEAARVQVVEEMNKYKLQYTQLESKLQYIDHQNQMIEFGLRAKVDAEREELQKSLAKEKQDWEHTTGVLSLSNEILVKENSQLKNELAVQVAENSRLMEENEKMADELFALMNSDDCDEEDSN